jgi:hypothetical protein
MKLYEVPRKTWVETTTGHKFFLDHVDGMYSFCREIGGAISHYSASMDVKVSEDQPGEPK